MKLEDVPLNETGLMGIAAMAMLLVLLMTGYVVPLPSSYLTFLTVMLAATSMMVLFYLFKPMRHSVFADFWDSIEGLK